MDGQSNSPDDSNVFVLYPVMIPGWVTPVQPAGIADGGIPKRIYDEAPEGLECLIDPWIEFRTRGIEPLALNDRVDLYIDSWPAAVAGKTIQPADVDQRIALHIPKDRLREGVNEIYYKVTRPSENSSRDSRKLKVLYHRFTPGEPDHSQRTVQLPPEVVNKGIDKAMAERGVVVGFDYPFRRAYDLIRLNVGRTYIDRRVEPNEASPITTTLFTPTFEAAGDNDKTRFEYLIIDQLSNTSVLSAPTYIDVHLARLDLKAPFLVSPATSPIDSLGYPNGVIVRVEFLSAQTGDKAQLIESNPLPGSVPFRQHPFNSNNRANFTLSPEFLRARHGTGFELRWQLIRDGKSIGESEPLRLEVKQIAEFLKPSIKEANGSTLNPVAAKDVLTVVVPANAVLLPTDRVIVKWTGAPGTPAAGSHTSVPRELGLNFEFPIPNSVVAFNLGLSVTVSYTITRGNGDPIPSQTFTLAVQALPQSALNRPTITQADNNGEGPELDVTKLTGNGTMRMSDWPLIAVGQFVWMHLEGTKADGKPYIKPMWAPPGSKVSQAWVRDGFAAYTGIPLAELQNLKNDSTLKMVFKAALGLDVSKPLFFPERTYTIKSIVLLKPVITSIKNGSTEVGVTLEVIGGTDTSVTVTGTATENLEIELFDNGVSKGIVPVGANKVWSKSVAVKVGLHSFTAKAKYGDNSVSTPRTFNQKALWNFVNGSFQGWVAQGNYAGTLNNNHGGVGSNTSTPQNIWQGMIMACPIQVEAGKRYKFTYQLRFVRTGNANVNGTTVTLYVGAAAVGSPVGVNYNIIGPVSGSGQYTASATGSVMLKFYNHIAQHYGNDFRFNNITMEEAVAVRGFDAPESPEEIVDRMETERLERLKAFDGLTDAERLKKLEGFVEPGMLEELKGLGELERLKALEELAGIAPFDKGKALEALKQQLIV
ncbi:hypothetical protein PMI36_03580 [Pseudomonas sp. GM79]|nr:hypothetical protein PMI36_03580 [Pseudomonas sp. GM79]